MPTSRLLPSVQFVVLAQGKDGDPDACEWTVYDGRTAEASAIKYAERLRERGYLHVHVRPCGGIAHRIN